MPKAPRDKENAAPKKRTRKAAEPSGNGIHAENGKSVLAGNGNGVHVENGNGALAQPVVPSLEVSNHVVTSPNLDDQIRRRAYEIYLERGGHGGSPEQDWLRAKEEISGPQHSA